jgi:hypothetical protein
VNRCAAAALDCSRVGFDSTIGMKYQCTITQQAGGRWRARHTGDDIGTIEVLATSRAEAVQKMENELRYRVEMCPCTGRAFRNLEIEIIEMTM